MKWMHPLAGQGANRSDTPWYREDLQRGHVGEGAISYANDLRDSTFIRWLAEGAASGQARAFATMRLYLSEAPEAARHAMGPSDTPSLDRHTTASFAMTGPGGSGHFLTPPRQPHQLYSAPWIGSRPASSSCMMMRFTPMAMDRPWVSRTKCAHSRYSGSRSA